MIYNNTLYLVVNIKMFSLIVDEREEKILTAKKEPSQIMQEVIHIAAATPSTEYVICAWTCIHDDKSLLRTVYYTMLT